MKNKTYLLFSLIILYVILLSSCSPSYAINKALENIDTTEPDLYLILAFENIYDKDYEAFSEVFDYPITKASFNELINSLNGGIEGDLVSYQLGGYFINKNNSIASYEYNYNVQTTESDYVFQIILVSENGGVRKFMGLKIHQGQLNDFQPKIVGKSPIQIGILIYSVLCIAFIIFAIVKCIKSKVRFKVLWIIGMLFQAGITFGKSQSTINFGLRIHFGISTYKIGNNGDFYLTLIFPIVALIFLAVKVRAEKKQNNLLEYIKDYEDEKLKLSNERTEDLSEVQLEVPVLSEMQTDNSTELNSDNDPDNDL